MYNYYNKDLYTADDVTMMIDDWFFDNADMEDVYGELVLDGAPYYDDGCWQQLAHDDKCDYLLIADAEGNIQIEYLGTH